MKEAITYYQMVIKKLCPNLSKKEYEAKKQNASNDFDEIIKIESPNATKEEYVECFIEYCNKLKAETPPLNIKCVNANCTILGTSGGGKHYDGIKGAANETSIN